MKKKIVINGRKYKQKNLVRIGIVSGKGVFANRKEEIVYSGAVCEVGMREGLRQYSTNSIEEKFCIIFYDTEGKADEIMIQDAEVDKEWQYIFVYMIGDKGAFLLYADRSILQMVGVRAKIGSRMYIPVIRQEAFNAAALVRKELLDELLSLETAVEQDNSKLTLLGVELKDDESRD